jgi:hypothetical protein
MNYVRWMVNATARQWVLAWRHTVKFARVHRPAPSSVPLSQLVLPLSYWKTCPLRESFRILPVPHYTQIVVVRKRARNPTERIIKRKHPLNGKIIGSNISEARDELNELLLKIDAGGLHEAELRVGLLHAYHHLNFAWNIRRVATSRYASLTQREFETWGRYPPDIETFGE